MQVFKEPSGKYEQGQVILFEDEVGYIVELPTEVQQEIEMTLKFVPNIKDIQQKLINKN
jgi:hypothetical protein